MPFGDGTGPRGMGPMTGRGAGYCAGYDVPGYANPAVYGYRGFGRGIWGRGRGHRYMYYATGLPLWARGGAWYAPPYAPQMKPEQEIEYLKEQADYFQSAMDNIKKRIADLEAKAEK